nr:hypothetical protein B0A51_10948 [Rachicladosporium sp. CCFEE 5018]
MVLSLTRLTYTSDYATSVEGSDRLIYVETRFDTGTRPQICSAILLIQEHDRCYFLLVETMDTGKAKRIGLACFPGFFELARTLRDPFVPLDAFSAIEGNKAIMTIV